MNRLYVTLISLLALISLFSCNKPGMYQYTSKEISYPKRIIKVDGKDDMLVDFNVLDKGLYQIEIKGKLADLDCSYYGITQRYYYCQFKVE